MRFADPPVVFSPDGRYFVVNTERGLPACNRAESTLRVFRTEDVKRGLSGAPRSRKLDSAWTLSWATYKDGPIISLVRWLPDSSGIAFLSKTEAGRNQLFLAELATKSVAPITPDDQDVKGYSVRNRRHFVYTALSPAIRERVILEAGAISIVGTGRSLNSLLFPENLYASQQGTHDLSELWAVFAGRRFRVIDKLSGRAIPIHFFGQQALSLSPNGRTVATATALTSVPIEWESLYPPAVSTSAYRVRAGRQDPEEFDGDRYISEYVLIDVITGRVKPLIQAPIAHATGWWGLPRSDWSKDGNSLVLANTFLPAAEEASAIEATRPCGVAIVELETRNLTCVAQLNGTSEGSKSGYAYVADVRFLTGSNARIIVEYLSGDYVSRGSANYIRVGNGTWRLNQINAEGAVPSDLDISVKQGPNDPPVLVSTDNAANTEQVIWDPNPQLRRLDWWVVQTTRIRRRVPLPIGHSDTRL